MCLRNRTLICLAIAPASMCSNLFAAETTTVLDPMVVSATRTAVPLSSAPASISVVTQEDFDEVQAESVSQVMKKLPNVDFGGGPRVNGEIPTIRGYSGKSINLLVDGARQDWLNNTLRSPLYIDPYFVSSAEVLRGPASSLYGPGGNGGVMSFRTIAVSDFLHAGETFGAGARIGAADADRSKHINARVYGQNGVVDALAAIGYHDWGTIRQGGDLYLAPNSGHAANGLLKVGANLGNMRFDLSREEYHSDSVENSNPQANSTLAGAPAVQNFHTSREQTVLRAATADKPGGATFSATLYGTDVSVTADQGASAAVAPNTLMRTRTTGVGLQGSLPFGNVETFAHRLTAGVDYYDDHQTSTSNFAPNPVIPDGKQNAVGVFVQDEISLGKSWSLTPSVRSDHFETTPASIGSATSASHTSPKVTLAWQAAEGATLYGSYGEAFRVPTLAELYQSISGTQFFSNFRQNPNLRPETDKTAEVGAKLSRGSVFAGGDRLNLRLAIFDGKAKDLVTTAVVGTYARTFPFVGTGSIFQAQNVTNANRKGGEAEGSYALGNWQFNAAYSRVRVTDASNGNGLFSPPDKLTLQLRGRLPSNGVSVMWNTTGVAAQDYDATVSRQRPGYATHDIFVNWAPTGQKFKVNVGITNLSDKKYSTYQSSNIFAYTYQEGRSLKAALSFDI